MGELLTTALNLASLSRSAVGDVLDRAEGPDQAAGLVELRLAHLAPVAELSGPVVGPELDVVGGAQYGGSLDDFPIAVAVVGVDRRDGGLMVAPLLHVFRHAQAAQARQLFRAVEAGVGRLVPDEAAELGHGLGVPELRLAFPDIPLGLLAFGDLQFQ